MFKGILAAAFLVAAGPVMAQQVFKCVDGREVSYQSDPCPKGPAQKSWDATPQPIDPYIEARLRAMQHEQDTRAWARRQGYVPSSDGGGAMHSVSQSRDRSACDQARAARKAAYDQAGVHRTFAMSRYWDNRVQEACK